MADLIENRRRHRVMIGLLTVLGALLLGARDCPDQPIISVESTEDQFVVSCKSFSTDVTYEWFNPTTSVSKSPFYAEPKKNGTLTCVVYNEVCNKNSSINFYTPDQPEVKSEGDNVTLVPQYIGDPSEIIWKVNGDNLVEMELKPQVDIFHRLQDRATISDTDGSLTIRHLTMEDYGVYTAEVLVNNEYYYTEIRLAVLESSGLSGGKKAGIGIGVLFLISIIFNIVFFLRQCGYNKSSRLPGVIIIFIVILIAILFIPIPIIFLLWYYCCRRPNQLENEWKSDSQPLLGKELERCITVQFCNDVTNGNDKSKKPFEDHLKTIIIHSVLLVDDGIFTADGKKCRFTKVENSLIIEYEDGETEQELVCMKDGVTMFEYAFSSLKLHASIITLEPGSVTVYNAEGKESYIVFFRLEETLESKSIGSITFHPSKMTGMDPITWEKDSELLNTEGGRIKCDPNGDLTIYNPTSEDKGTYTVQCIDNELDQEFILHLQGWKDST